MKYEDASWHYGAINFPTELTEENGFTHIGMFLSWAFENDFAGEFHLKECAEDMKEFELREMTGREIFIKNCDGKLTDEDLNQEGNEFAMYYYNVDNYLIDYGELFENEKSVYHVEDTWENQKKVSEMIEKEYKRWKSKKENR